MTRFRQAALALFLAAMVGIGCTTPVGLSPSTVPLKPGEYTVISRDEVQGRALGVWILGVPFTRSNPAGLARDRAMEKAGAKGLINVAVDLTQYNLIVVHLMATTVYGIPVTWEDS